MEHHHHHKPQHHEHHGAEHHEKGVPIVVNGRQKHTHKHELTFADLVHLAFENPPSGEAVQFTIQYTRGHGPKPAGTLLEGQLVKLKAGMEFDVTATNRS